MAQYVETVPTAKGPVASDDAAPLPAPAGGDASGGDASSGESAAPPPSEDKPETQPAATEPKPAPTTMRPPRWEQPPEAAETPAGAAIDAASGGSNRTPVLGLVGGLIVVLALAAVIAGRRARRVRADRRAIHTSS